MKLCVKFTLLIIQYRVPSTGQALKTLAAWQIMPPHVKGCKVQVDETCHQGCPIDIEYYKRLGCQRPCLEDELTAGSSL